MATKSQWVVIWESWYVVADKLPETLATMQEKGAISWKMTVLDKEMAYSSATIMATIMATVHDDDARGYRYHG